MTATRRSGTSTFMVEPCPPIDAVDPTLPPAARSAARKTEGLKLALAKHGFDGLIAGIRRDEEPTRAKERVFSPRGTRRRLGRARPAAGVLGSVQCLAAARRASAHPSDPALDRGRHLGLHAARRHSDHPALSRARRQALSLARRRRHHVPGRLAGAQRSTRSSPSSTPPTCPSDPDAPWTTNPRTRSSACASRAISEFPANVQSP